jgi:hypothetical protein
MEFKELNSIPNLDQDNKLKKHYASFEKLLAELKKREIPSELIHSINQYIEAINSFSGSNKALRKQIQKLQSATLKLVEKELQLVPINHYRNAYMALGMGFGVAIGVALGTSKGNTSLLAIGLPIGMVIGLAIGNEKDKKTKEKGLQLDLEIT